MTPMTPGTPMAPRAMTPRAVAHDLDTLSVNTIRGLCMDAIQKADSGHPGTPMGIAPVAYTLWQRFLRFDPADPIWPNRDRFVLSEGHASALLWSLLHLTGVRAVNPDYEVLGRPAVGLEDLKSFRRLDSHCPGHPEYRWTSGVETTTGPLGQGVATSAGMAMAGRWLAARFNRDGFPTSPTAYASTSTRGSAPAALNSVRTGSSASRATAAPIPISPTRWSASSGGSSPTAGRARFPPSPPTRRAWRPANPRAGC
ncbi:hypothetical protein [Streptomyces sp. 8N616]|uniref:hypothetical protein n=1 Tax=Streptomyces sp. 8N616 TaxID=3457414 RepID=UPI003FCFC7C3